MVIHSNSDITSNTSHTRHKASNMNVTADKADKVADTSSAQKTSSDDVTLSQKAQTFERLEAKITASDGVDTAKVDQIKQQIADGNYEINSSNIADALIQQETA